MLPLCKEGLKATARLRKLRIITNVTLIFDVSRALLAARARARFVSPFIERINHPLTDKGIEKFNSDWASAKH